MSMPRIPIDDVAAREVFSNQGDTAKGYFLPGKIGVPTWRSPSWNPNFPSWSPAPEGGVDGRLVQVHVVYTHGHISPAAFYPKDLHAFSPIWSNGPLELTILGAQQGYRLGQQLRARYETLLPKTQPWKVVRATSSDTSRTLMTSNVLLAGLLPPSAYDIRSNFTWQQATVHTCPAEHDNILAPNIHCPKYKDLLIRTANRDDNENRMFYRLLKKYTGEEIQSPKALVDLYRCMELELQANLTLPKWTRSLYRTLRRQAVSALRESTKTIQLKRLRSGSLINLLMDYKKSWNIRLYCTHDTVLSSLMDSLGLYKSEIPTSTSALIVEHREYEGAIYTQFWYKQRPDGEFIRLQLPVCDIRCSLKQLRNQLKPLTIKDWREECTLVQYGRDVGSELRCVFAIIIVFVLLGLYLIKKYSKDAYVEL